MINTYRHLLFAASQYDPLSTEYFRIVRAVSSYDHLIQRWYDDPQSRPQLEPLIEQTRQWCVEIQYAITNQTKIPALREIEKIR
ncbi:MAG: hypothetical protein K8J31_20960 [Anaerolineae bacterium]|nr:hypothetical protein [Anaerolineae bacterium]